MRVSTFSLGSTLAIALPLWAGCAGKSADECVIGTVGCLCYPNYSCDDDLECNRSTNVCMAASAGAGSGAPEGSGGTSSGGVENRGGDGDSSGAAGVTGVVAGAGGVVPTGGTESVGGGSGAPTGGITGIGGDATGGGTGGTGGTAGTAGTGGQSVTGGATGAAGSGGVEPQGGTAGVSGTAGAGGDAAGGGGAPSGGATTGGAAGAGGAPPIDRGPCVNIGFIGEDRSTATDAASDQVITWLESLGEAVTVARIDANDALTDAVLAPFHLAIVGNMESRGLNGERYTAADIEALTAWVEGGGGLMTLAGYTGDEIAVQPASDLLSLMGLSYNYEGLGAGVIAEGDPPNIVSVVEGVTHPVVSGVTQLGGYYGYPVVTVNANDRVLIKQEDYALAVVHQQVGGRVLVYFDDWITLVSEWPNHTDLQHETFWRNSLNWLLAPLDCTLPG